jgi:hypothetical protein
VLEYLVSVRPLMNQTLADTLGKLLGHTLGSVEFVGDYVQLWFDGPCMTAYTLPKSPVWIDTLHRAQ